MIHLVNSSKWLTSQSEKAMCELRQTLDMVGQTYLENQLHGKDPGECVIKMFQNRVASGVLRDWILGSQSNTARTNHNHDEQIKVAQVDDKMTKSSNSASVEFTKMAQERRKKGDEVYATAQRLT